MFRQFPLKWAFWWLLLPNLAIIAMWAIGGPAMSEPIFACGILALLVSQSRRKSVRVAGIVAIFAVLLVTYVGRSFNLGYDKLFLSVAYLDDLNPTVAPEYTVAGLLLVASLAAAIRFAPDTPPLKSREQKLLALAAVAMVVNVDAMATTGTRGSYKASAPAGTPIDSAVLQNHIAPDKVTARNLIVIIVESLGVPDNASDRALFDKAWNPSRWNARYAVTTGSSAYYGSTTNAELREWCGVWADYSSFDFNRAHCLPQDFRAAGFHTISIHAFDGDFFQRKGWYPKIGFQERHFGPDLLRHGASPCGGVFPGACDTDIPRLIGERLRQSGRQRNLVYWLTLNSHLPVVSDGKLGTDRCRLGAPEWRQDFPTLCRSYTLLEELSDAITAEIMKPDFPEADILIVGDHMPPFFPRSMRSRFDNAHVPWIYLRNRAALERGEAATPSRRNAS